MFIGPLKSVFPLPYDPLLSVAEDFAWPKAAVQGLCRFS